MTRYYESFQGSRNRLFAITIADGGSFVGTVTLREIGYQGLYDLGIFIGDKTVRGRGYARETISAVTHHALSQLNGRKITSSFTDDNYPVMMAFLKNGFRIEGFQRAQQCGLDGTISNRYIVGLLASDRSVVHGQQ